jgi:outer membrane protein assembly factor BamB
MLPFQRRLLGLLLLGVLAAGSRADDYPQWRGPNRDGVSKETGLLKQWPKGGPKLLWKVTDLGKGYSTPSVAKGRIYVLSNRDDEEFALALDAGDKGKQLWSTPIGKVGKNQGPQYPGARSTPTVDGDALYVLGSDGDLVCLDAVKGKVRWRKQLRKDFGGKPGAWAYAESPLIDGDVLVCTPGGAKATLVALNKRTGAVIWRSAVPGGDDAAYASAVVATVGGKKQYIQFLQNGLVGVDAKTGKFLWRFDKTIDPAANIPTPIVHDGFVFSTTGRNQGGLIKLLPDKGGSGVMTVYLTKKLATGLGGLVLVDGYLYGTTGQGLVCAHFATGMVKWQDRSVGRGSVCYADGRLYVRNEEGKVALVEATPAEYREKGLFEEPQHSGIQTWPYPVVANGCLFLRDQDVLLCYAVK